MASYKVEFSKSARMDFKGLPKNDALRILEKIKSLESDPRPLGSKKLKGEESYRIRIGMYRVIYDIRDSLLVVLVLRVGHRKEIYRP
ncbi:MAG: type II toxin-antitoxin system RelE family toxin [Opitutales bacterium]